MKRRASQRSAAAQIVVLFDLDNTLLYNYRVIADLNQYPKREVGSERARQYWTIFERLRARLGYADYLGALQRYRHSRCYPLFRTEPGDHGNRS